MIRGRQAFCRVLVFLLFFFFSSISFAAIVFTGITGDDFQAASCMADPGGEDVGMPAAFGGTEISGFDIRSLCFSYDPALDILYIGLETHIDASGNRVIFGDADGDGDPGGAGLTLQTLLGEDFADLDEEEYVTLAIDFDDDDAPDLVVGTHADNALSDFTDVGGVAAPDNHLLLAPLDQFYGAAVGGVAAANAHLPSNAKPHLEFSISNFSSSPGYGALDFSDPDSAMQLYLTTGSLGDDGIAEEFFPNIATYKKMSVEFLIDTDGDTINNALDSDDDNDTLSDLIEKDLAPLDTDGDGSLSDAEIAASGLDADGDGDIDTNDGITWPDADGDQTPDYLDTDSDGDGVPDALEGSLGAGDAVTSSSGGESRLGGDVDLSLGGVRLQGSGCSVLPGAANFGILFWWVLLLIGFGLVPKVWGLNSDLYRFNNNGLGFLNHDSILVLPPKEFALGVSTHLVHRPLDFGLAGSGRNLDNIVSYFYVWDLWGAVGVYENVEVGLNFPISLLSQVEGLESSVERNSSSLGDLRLQGKWRFIEKFALLTFIDFPTGSRNEFFGERDVNGGLKILAEHYLGRHELGAHLGSLFRRTETITSSGIDLLKIGPEMLWGVGWRWHIDKKWRAMSHLWGKTDFGSEATSPLEWDFAFSKEWNKVPLETHFGIGFGMNKGYGSPTYRLLFGMRYVSNKPKGYESNFKKAAPPRPAVKLQGREIIILRPIHFDTGKAALKGESLSILDDVARLLKKNKTILKVRIDGHTDSDGSDAFNLHLSRARAIRVKEYLIEWGLDPKQLVTKGWGERQPVIPNHSPENKAGNRRVEFHVIEVER